MKIPETWVTKSRANVTAKLPYAYMVSEEDPLLLVPDPKMVPFVEEAMDYLDSGHSYRVVADWLFEKTGQKISHQGISNIWHNHRGDKKSPKMQKLKAEARKKKPKTAAEKIEQDARLKMRIAKRSQTVARQKLEKLEAEKAAADPDYVPSTPLSDSLDHEARPEQTDIVFQPNPGPQTEFLAASEREVLYGGSAGGGKTYALIADPMRYFGNKNFNGIILRRTNDELREIIWKSQEIYPRAYPGAKWQEKKSQWVFPSGAKLWMTYLERDEDVLRYQGQAFCVAVGTPVLLADGSYRPVEHLSVGDMVQTLEGPQPIDWVSKRLRKKCVKVSVYDSEGHLLGEQLQPDTHPIALLSSEPYSQLSDACRSVGQFRSSPIEWHSAEHLRSLNPENRETFVSAEDGHSRNTEYAGEHPRSLPPLGYFYPAVLHVPSLPSVPYHDATQYHTCDKSLQQLPGICRESPASSSGLQQPCELEQSQTHHNKQLSCPSCDDASYALTGTQTVLGSLGYCPSCHRSHDEQSRPGTGFDSGDVPLLDDAVGQALDGLPCDERDCTLLRNRYLRKQYTHPYTQEPRGLAVPVSVGIVHVVPIDDSPCNEVIDLNVRSSNHYITQCGIVNRNCYIAFDELTQHATPFSWNYMRSRLRTTDPELPIFMRATTNPGGPGHGWVKAMFIDPAPPNKTFPATDLDTGEVLRYPDTHKNAGKPLFYRRFIPASLYDNPYLTSDGAYEANLLSLPEMQRRQLLEGDWNIASGAAFPEFKLSKHVIEPFEIPNEWRRFRSCDYGYSSHSAVHWYAIDPNYSTLYVYRELYVSKHTGKDLGRAVLEAERGESIQYGVLDSSCWHQRGQIGPSIAEEMISMGCKWRPSDRSAGARVSGKNRLHELLKIDPVTDIPGIVFFNNCRQIIADLPVIPSDPKGGDDIDQRYTSDHTYDSLRYGVMSRPRAASPFEDIGKAQQINRWRPSDSMFGY